MALTLLTLLGSLLTVSLPAALLLLAAFLVWAARLEWRGNWRGHVLVIRNTTLTETLFIDGREVAQGQGRFKVSETLTATIDDGGEQVPVLALLEPANMGFSVGARLFVAGEAIPLERGGLGTFSSERAARPGELTERIPSDPRWKAMLSLVEPIRRRGGESVGAVCDQAVAQVRALLLDIEDMAVAEEAHKLLDGEEGSGWQQAAAIREQRESQVRALFRAIQALHLQTTAAGDLDPSDLLARLQGEAEIAANSRKPTDLARARMAQRIRQSS